MLKFQNYFLKTLKTLLILVAVAVAVSHLSVLAASFTEPTSGVNPPGNNILPPITADEVGQSKSGRLAIGKITPPTDGVALDVNGLLSGAPLMSVSGSAYYGGVARFGVDVSTALPAGTKVATRVLKTTGGLIVPGCSGTETGAYLCLSPLGDGHSIYSMNVLLKGNYLYINSFINPYVTPVGYEGVEIFDITNPSKPFWVGGIADGIEGASFSGGAGVFRGLNMSIKDDYLYVGDGTLEILDIHDSSNPRHVGKLLNSAKDLVVSGDYVYTTYPSIAKINITFPANPQWESISSLLGAEFGNPVISDSFVYAVNDKTLYIFNTSNITNPIKSISLNIGSRTHVAAATSQHYLYLSSRDEGGKILIYDISDGVNPQLLSTLKTGGDLWTLVVSGDYVYATGVSCRLVIVDVSNKNTPKLVGSDCPGSSIGRSISVDGNYAAVVGGAGLTYIFDVSDKTKPVVKSYIYKAGYGMTIK